MDAASDGWVPGVNNPAIISSQVDDTQVIHRLEFGEEITGHAKTTRIFTGASLSIFKACCRVICCVHWFFASHAHAVVG